MAGARQRSSRLQVDQLSPIPAAIDTSSSDNVEEFPAGSQLGDFIAKKIKVINILISIHIHNIDNNNPYH